MTIAASLLEAFSVLPDPRLARGKEHRWSKLLFIAVCALLTGGESFYDMEEFGSLRQDKTPGCSIKRKQRRAAFDTGYLESLLKF